jgi:hypothetical protein
MVFQEADRSCGQPLHNFKAKKLAKVFVISGVFFTTTITTTTPP